jgi:PAS domain S-box-containing protein
VTAADDGPPEQGRDPTSRPAKAPVRVLVVDDDASKRLALAAALAPLGFTVVEADSGVAALRCVSAEDFAVILLDVRMPAMDGFETAGLIRQRQRSEMTPIIFITASTSDEIVSRDRYAQGAVDFIFAPVNPTELRAKVSVFANLYANAETLATKVREVQTSADQLRLLTDVAPIGIFQTDTENRYVYVNPRWCENTGLTREQALGSTLGSMLGSRQRFDVLARLAGPAVLGAEFSYRYELPGPDAAGRVNLLTAVTIPDTEGGIAGWAGTLADVTAEVGAEAAMSEARDAATAASKLKSDFLANMSHEIRTPMNGVIGMTDLLLETDLDARQRDYAQTVRNSGEALLTIINDILDFSKIEAGMLDVEDNEFDLRIVVHDVIDLLVGSAQAKAIELVAIVESSVPTLVRGDSGRLRQVLMNLVGNAIKFTQVGEVVLRVADEDVTDDQIVIRFEVADTGDGIAVAKQREIFHPFVQADTSTSRRYGGTGLGLAISAQLVKLMGGDYGVESEPGAGSLFWFTIAVHVIERASSVDATDTDLAGRSALIVDDNAAQRDVLYRHLSEWGLRATTAPDAESALGMLRDAVRRGAPFAVALVDRSMPDMDGLELRDVIASDPAIDTPLVLMIGIGQERDLAETDTTGFCAVLPRPVHPADLMGCLRVALALPPVPADGLATATPRSVSRGGLATGRLLLAEDNVVNQKVAVAMLSSAGYQVDTVFDGAGAVQRAEAVSYDAILMDCQMPGLNGYEATAAIRAREGTGRRTPIIAMTAGARSEDRERCLAAGMDSYIAKPASKDALVALVAAAIGAVPERPVPAASHPVASPADDRTLDPVLFAELSALGVRRERTCGGDLVAELVSEFIADTEVRLVQLDDFLLAREAVAVARFAYLIKGSASQLGGRRLALSCNRLEGHAAEGALADCRVDLGRLEQDYRALRSALSAHLSTGVPRRTSDEPATGAPAPGRSGGVLVADNNRISQQVARAMLENLGFDVDIARDGVAAVRAASERSYRAILIDCSTQALDSDHTTTEIRRQGASGPRATIIAVSASATLAERQRCLMSGMDDFLAKPFRTDALATLLGGAPEGPQPAIEVTSTHRIKVACGSVDPRLPVVDDAVLDNTVLDDAVLAQLERLGEDTGEDLLGELGGLFLSDADRHVAALHQARRDADADQIARSTHALRGASADLGATELSRLCSVAETPDGVAEFLADPSLLDAILSELGRVRTFLDVRSTRLDPKIESA